MPATQEDPRVAFVGLGPIGQRIAGRILARPGLRVVGAADINPALAGKDLGTVAGASVPAGVEVVGGIEALPRGPGVAILTTTSRLSGVAAQVEALIARGWNVLSTSEELSYPYVIDQAIAAHLDGLAKQHDVSVLGTGINPGFLLDTLVLALRYACARADAVRVTRKVNTDQRRAPLQKKVGVGMTRAEFEEKAQAEQIGHIGLRQSAYLLASGLGWTIADYKETIEPVLAQARTSTGLGPVEPGQVIGQHQHALAAAGATRAIEYELWMYAGCASEDRILIEGEPAIRQVIEGGVNGDIGTEAMVSNLVEPLAAARPGLRVMSELVSLA